MTLEKVNILKKLNTITENYNEFSLLCDDIFNNRSWLQDQLISYYEADTKNYKLEVWLNNKKRVAKVLLISPLECMDENIKDIMNEFSNCYSNNTTIVEKRVLLSSIPVRGEFISESGKFKILPPPDSAKKPQKGLGKPSYPFILEYQVEHCNSRSVNYYRDKQRFLEILYLLYYLLDDEIRYLNCSQKTWFTTDFKEFIWGQEYYSQEAIGGYSTDSKFIGEKIELIPFSCYPKLRFDYYFKIIKKVKGYDLFPAVNFRTHSLLLPNYTDYVFKLYDSLDYQKKEIIFSALHYIYTSKQIESDSFGQSFTCLITAAECLADDGMEQRNCLKCNEKLFCENCKEPQMIGPTQLFKKLISEYAPEEDHVEYARKNYGEEIAEKISLSLNKSFSRWLSDFYKFRSQIVHGSLVSLVDLDSSFSGSNRLKVEEEYLKEQLVRLLNIIVLRWLIKQSGNDLSKFIAEFYDHDSFMKCLKKDYRIDVDLPPKNIIGIW